MSEYVKRICLIVSSFSMAFGMHIMPEKQSLNNRAASHFVSLRSRFKNSIVHAGTQFKNQTKKVYLNLIGDETRSAKDVIVTRIAVVTAITLLIPSLQIFVRRTQQRGQLRMMERAREQRKEATKKQVKGVSSQTNPYPSPSEAPSDTMKSGTESSANSKKEEEICPVCFCSQQEIDISNWIPLPCNNCKNQHICNECLKKIINGGVEYSDRSLEIRCPICRAPYNKETRSFRNNSPSSNTPSSLRNNSGTGGVNSSNSSQNSSSTSSDYEDLQAYRDRALRMFNITP